MATYEELVAAARQAQAEGRQGDAERLARQAVNLKRGLGDDEDDGRTTSGDIARGIAAGLVDIPQGLAELGAIGLDMVADTDYADDVTSFFEGVKTSVGAVPTSTAGHVAEGITNFGLAFLPVVGWLGRAGKVAAGAQILSKGGRFARSAEAFGRSSAGRALVGSRMRLAGTTTLAGGVSDFFVSPEGYGTMADAFDVLPDWLESEDDANLNGRDEAFRRLRNKLRIGAEGAAAGAVFEAAFPVAKGAATAISQVPGVPQAARLITQGVDAASSAVVRKVPFLQRNLTSAGTTPGSLFEDLEGTGAFVDTMTKEAELAINAFDNAAKKATASFASSLRFGGRPGLTKAYDDLLMFLQGDAKALDTYDDAVKTPAHQMRDQINLLSGKIVDQISSSTATPEIKKQILDVFQKNTNSYLRRLFERFEDPNWVVDPKIRTSPLFKRAVDEVAKIVQRMDESAVKTGERLDVRVGAELTQEADRAVTKLIGLGDMDLGVSPNDVARIIAGNSAVKLNLTKNGGAPLYQVAEDILMSRSKFIEQAPSLRELMGEIKDPKTLFLRTIGDMSQMIAGNRLYKQMSDTMAMSVDDAKALAGSGGRPMVIKAGGMDTEALAKELGYLRLGETKTDTIFGGGFGELTGAWVAPEIYKAVTTPMQMTTGVMNELLALSLQAKGAAQAAKTVYSPITQVRNFISGVFLTLANGNIMRGMSFSDSFRLTAGKAADLSDKEFQDLFTISGNLGLRDQNLTVNEFRELMKEGATYKFAGKTAGGLQKFVDHIPFASALKKVYSGSDTFWKLVNWNAERAKYAAAFRKAGILESTTSAPSKLRTSIKDLMNSGHSTDDIAARLGVPADVVAKEVRDAAILDDLVKSGLASRSSEITGSASFLDAMAGSIVKNTQPTYHRVPELIKNIRKVPVIGNFVAFPAEVIRNTANIVDRGLREMGFKASPELIARIGKDQAAILEKQIRAIGAQRISGYMASAVVFPNAIQFAAKDLMNWSDEQMRDLQAQAPEYMRGHQLVPLTQAGDPNVEYIDLSYMMPYDYAFAPARAALQAYQEKGTVGADEAEQIRSALWSGLQAYAEPFASESLVGERINDVFARGGVTKTGQEIFTEDSALGDKLSSGFTHIGAAFIPGAMDLLTTERAGKMVQGRLTRAITGTPSAAGQPYDLYEEGAALFTGLRPMQLRLDETFKYRGFEYNEAFRNASNVFGRVANANDTTSEDVVSAYRKGNEQLYRSQSRLFADVQAARRLGMTDRQIRLQLRQEANLGTEQVNNIMRGVFVPLSLSDDRVKNVIREGRTQERVLKRLPVREIRRLERLYRRQPLVEDLLQEKPAPEQEGTEQGLLSRILPAAAANNTGPAPTQPRAAQPMAIPPAPAQPAAAPSFSLLGANPIDALRNLEIFQRGGGS